MFAVLLFNFMYTVLWYLHQNRVYTYANIYILKKWYYSLFGKDNSDE